MIYDYYKNMEVDIKDALSEYDYNWYGSVDEQYDQLYDSLWIDDSVTGNGSGSYTFNTILARRYLQGNEDLLIEALEEFGGDYKRALQDPEYADVTIRCYILGQVLTKVLKELKEI